MKMISLVTVLLGMATFAFGAVDVPEINATSATSALALLSGGVMMLRGRRKK